MSPTLLIAMPKITIPRGGPYTERETLLLFRALCALKERGDENDPQALAGDAGPDEIEALAKKVIGNADLLFSG